ncbi:MAG: hypothetical protein APF84_00140 [Gracilibacter sp. BRH_c7a]|nr:MAG: hypothetical protein APF84_00140 [Gracilibacter sp. BRH_c7a]
MIAEIYHKSVDTGSEDQLTGNVFGTLRYLPLFSFYCFFVHHTEPLKPPNPFSFNSADKSSNISRLSVLFLHIESNKPCQVI